VRFISSHTIKPQERQHKSRMSMSAIQPYLVQLFVAMATLYCQKLPAAIRLSFEPCAIELLTSGDHS